jgi:hypothetical protein
MRSPLARVRRRWVVAVALWLLMQAPGRRCAPHRSAVGVRVGAASTRRSAGPWRSGLLRRARPRSSALTLASCASQLEGMVNDFSVGEDLERQFQAHLAERRAKAAGAGAAGAAGDEPKAPPPIELSVQVLTQGFWPAQKKHGLALPRELVACRDTFEHWYKAQNEMRVLQWLYTLGDVLVKGTFGRKAFDMSVSPFQASAWSRCMPAGSPCDMNRSRRGGGAKKTELTSVALTAHRARRRRRCSRSTTSAPARASRSRSSASASASTSRRARGARWRWFPRARQPTRQANCAGAGAGAGKRAPRRRARGGGRRPRGCWRAKGSGTRLARCVGCL